MPGVEDDGSFITDSPVSAPWPFTKGTRYDSQKTEANAGGSAVGYGPWTDDGASGSIRKPLFDGWWSGITGRESAGPLVPENNDGDFMMRPFSKMPHYRYPNEPLPIGYNPAYTSLQTSGSSYLAGPYNMGILENVGAEGHDMSDKFIPLVPPVGYVKNWLDSVELVIGGNRTGFIPASSLEIKNIEEFGLKNCKNACGIYAIKLADEAFSTAGVPFSKCNSIKLNIRIRTAIYGTKSFSSEAWQNGWWHSFNITPFAMNKDWTTQGYPKLVATAIGTTVQTTVGGSISFAA